MTTVAVVKPAPKLPRLRVPWISLFGLAGVASLVLAFQDSRREWTILLWALSSLATTFGVFVGLAVCHGNEEGENFILGDVGIGVVLALGLWTVPFASGLAATDYGERFDALPADQRVAATLWCQVRYLGKEYEEPVRDCTYTLTETPFRQFKRLPAVVADPGARGELFRQIEAYLARPVMAEKDAVVKADVQEKLDAFRHDQAEARAQRALIASLPPALYRDENGCSRSLETGDRSGACVRLAEDAVRGGDK